VKIKNVVHKGLKRFIERDDPSGLPPASVAKIRNILSFLQDIDTVDELETVPGWKAHRLTGDRKGYWSLTVTRNWRITFHIDADDNGVLDLNYEDYH
jgi:toxin HigB-1